MKKPFKFGVPYTDREPTSDEMYQMLIESRRRGKEEAERRHRELMDEIYREEKSMALFIYEQRQRE